MMPALLHKGAVLPNWVFVLYTTSDRSIWCIAKSTIPFHWCRRRYADITYIAYDPKGAHSSSAPPSTGLRENVNQALLLPRCVLALGRASL